MNADRERAVSRAFVGLTNSLVDGADVVDLLSQLTADCAQLLDVASAGLLLADPRGVLHVMAASSERTRSLEMFQVQRGEGPCLDCFHTGMAVSVPDLSEQAEKWPRFVGAAADAGFASVHALPMRLRDHVLGALGLFGNRVGALNDDDLSLGQSLAHAASVALVADRATADTAMISEQVRTALNTRVQVEQAKGLLAQQGGMAMDQAFAALRGYARNRGLRLGDVARLLVSRELLTAQVLDNAADTATLL